jgi:GTPase Era involved in 16S rRNA processing
LYVDTPSHQVTITLNLLLQFINCLIFSTKKILVGAGGSTLKYICNEAEQTLQEIFGRTFKIILCAKVRKSTSATFNFQNRTTAEELLGYRLSPSQPLSDIQDE